jgi:hypothetical protein
MNKSIMDKSMENLNHSELIGIIVIKTRLYVANHSEFLIWLPW